MRTVRDIKKELQKMDYLAAVDNKDLVQWADNLARIVKDAGLKTSQIRKFLDGVRKVDLQIKRRDKDISAEQAAVLLKVHLAMRRPGSADRCNPCPRYWAWPSTRSARGRRTRRL